MKATDPKRSSRTSVLLVPVVCFLVLQGCARNIGLSDIGLLPAGHSVVFAAPAGKLFNTRSFLFGRANNLPETVGFRFQRVAEQGESPAFLDLIGAADQSVRMYAARPGAYRLVQAYMLSQPWKRRWSFEQSPAVLEVREGEAVYVGTLHWRDYWVDVVNNEAEARALYDKRQQEFRDRSLDFATRLVRVTEYSR